MLETLDFIVGYLDIFLPLVNRMIWSQTIRLCIVLANISFDWYRVQGISHRGSQKKDSDINLKKKFICWDVIPMVNWRTAYWTLASCTRPCLFMSSESTIANEPRFPLSINGIRPDLSNQNYANWYILVCINTDQSEWYNLEISFTWNEPKWELWLGKLSIKCDLSFVWKEHNLDCYLNLSLLGCSSSSPSPKSLLQFLILICMGFSYKYMLREERRKGGRKGGRLKWSSRIYITFERPAEAEVRGQRSYHWEY